MPEEKAPYLIFNKSKAFRVKYYQANCPGDSTTLYDDEKMTFVWPDLRHPQELNFRFYNTSGDEYAVALKTKKK
jgi:hypothetical protein